jgi:hypothetical protein
MKSSIKNAMVILAMSSSFGFAQLYPPRSGDLAASIPFDFEANGKSMKAGEYIVRADSESGVVSICQDGVYCASIEASRLGRDDRKDRLQLVFTKHGGKYYLSFVICEQGECFELPMLQSQGADDRFERVKARKLVIHQFKGLPMSWS